MDKIFVPKDSSLTTDYVINQLKELLITGKLRPGDRLPSEFELAESFGVSRGSIRSAMKVFEVCGVVDIRRGDGTYVCKTLSPKRFNPLVLTLALLGPGTKELAEFREKIELDILELIIKDRELSRAVLPRLEKNLEELGRLQERQAPLEELAANDSAFHMLLASGCGNRVFEAVCGYIWDFFHPLILDSHQAQTLGEMAAADHRRMYEAIREGDFSMAKEAVARSMQFWYRSLQKE